MSFIKQNGNKTTYFIVLFMKHGETIGFSKVARDNQCRHSLDNLLKISKRKENREVLGEKQEQSTESRLRPHVKMPGKHNLRRMKKICFHHAFALHLNFTTLFKTKPRLRLTNPMNLGSVVA